MMSLYNVHRIRIPERFLGANSFYYKTSNATNKTGIKTISLGSFRQHSPAFAMKWPYWIDGQGNAQGLKLSFYSRPA